MKKQIEVIMPIYEEEMADWERELSELVRCKDCKFYDNFSQECRNGLDGIFTPDWYCADGVKKDDK